MKKIINYIAITSLIIFYLSSCKKNNTNSTAIPLEVKLNTEGLAYIQLPLNKYFIYKDSATIAIDSVVVTKSLLEKRFVPESRFSFSVAYNVEIYSLVLTKITSTGNSVWFNAATFDNYIYATSNTLPVEMKEPNNLTVFYYPVPTCNCSSPILIPSIIIEGKTYNNVIEFIAWNGLMPGNANYFRSAHYWAKGIGIIKREIQNANSVKTELLIRNG